MAKVVKIKSQLKRNKTKAFLNVALAFLLASACVVFGFGLLVLILLKKITLHIAIPIILLISSLICIVVFLSYRKRYGILQAGVRGEDTTRKILQKLPKEFTVLTNPVILNRGITMELDFVVVGKNGVFIVESKNHRGIITGKTSWSSWKQVKHGKNDKVYEKEITNPVKQAYRQSKRMEEVFRDFNIAANVYSILYFVDNRTELKIIDDADMNVAIFNNEESLLNYIRNTKGRETVSSDELAKIIRFFKR
jgi:hypothetical protein